MLKGFQIRSVLCCWYRFCLSSDHHNYEPKFIEEMLELCFLKLFFFFNTTQLHFCWLAQRRCNKMHKEEMCEEALSSVCVVNKILCLFNQNQTCFASPDAANRTNTTCETLQVHWHRACTLVVMMLFLISISYFLAFPSSRGKFGKTSDAPHA